MEDWIDYKKQKPQKSGNCLVVEGWWRGKLQTSIRYYIHEEGCKGFNSSFEVLYWFPIPELPKIEG
jgi:hypothetical protein